MSISLAFRFTAAAIPMLLAPFAFGADSVDELVKKGDAMDARNQPKQALACYLPAEKQSPENVRLLVRIARQYRHLIPTASSDQEKLRLGGVALGYAKRAAALAPNDAEANLSMAISYGKMIPFEDARDQVEGSRQLRASVDKAISLDPRNDLAWHVLGRWHQVVADVGGVKRVLGSLIYGKLPPAKNEDAVACFQKAIALNPERPMHYIELGRTYANMGRGDEARRMIQKGLGMPDSEHDDREVKRKGRETLKKLG
jgi:tetratricopeptide (TPR) repeat protein